MLTCLFSYVPKYLGIQTPLCRKKGRSRRGQQALLRHESELEGEKNGRYSAQPTKKEINTICSGAVHLLNRIFSASDTKYSGMKIIYT